MIKPKIIGITQLSDDPLIFIKDKFKFQITGTKIKIRNVR